MVKIIPIGCQCSTVVALKNNGTIRKEAFPFDGMLSYPSEVLRIMQCLLGNEEVNFFEQLERSNSTSTEHYYSDPSGFAVTNVTNKLTFPHDKDNDEDREKYKRRMQRLKDVILSNEPILFIYCDPSGPQTHFTYNGKCLNGGCMEQFTGDPVLFE